jgi:hypothetical protein
VATSGLRKDIVHYTVSIHKKLQLARANNEFGLHVANAAKLNMLRVIRVPEPELGSLVKTFYYVGYIRFVEGLPQQP